MAKNSIGIELPEQVGSYTVRPYAGRENPQTYQGTVVSRRKAVSPPTAQTS